MKKTFVLTGKCSSCPHMISCTQTAREYGVLNVKKYAEGILHVMSSRYKVLEIFECERYPIKCSIIRFFEGKK